MNWLRQHIVNIVWAITFAGLAVNATVSAINLRTLANNNERMFQRYAMLLEMEAFFSSLKDAETGQRGYLITGEERYLAPYQEALGKIKSHATRLREGLQHDPGQIARMEQLDAAATARLAELHATIDVRRLGGLDAARAAVLEGEGRKRMQDMREIVTALQDTEKERLLEQKERVLLYRRTALATDVIGGVLVLGITVLAWFLIRRELIFRHQAERSLADANAELEERVTRRTADLATSNAELRTEIAERRRLEEQARLISLELQRSNRELEQFAAVASHDLQEPLRKIQTFGDRLQTRFAQHLPETGLDCLQRVLAAASRMRTLIDDLLAFSRINTKGQALVPVDLQEVVRDVVSDLEGRLQQTEGKVIVGALPKVKADPLQLRQLFQNLIGNGLKFHRTETPPVVRVQEAGGEDGFCRILVEDNGIGFENTYAERIFQVFQRLHERGVYEGTGMGLAICRKIVERHGGRITAHGAPGQGATFEVFLPAPSGITGGMQSDAKNE